MSDSSPSASADSVPEPAVPELLPEPVVVPKPKSRTTKKKAAVENEPDLQAEVPEVPEVPEAPKPKARAPRKKEATVVQPPAEPKPKRTAKKTAEVPPPPPPPPPPVAEPKKRAAPKKKEDLPEQLPADPSSHPLHSSTFQTFSQLLHSRALEQADRRRQTYGQLVAQMAQ